MFPNDVDQNMKLIPTLEEFKTTDNIHDAAASFLAIFEKSASINLLIASDLNHQRRFAPKELPLLGRLVLNHLAWPPEVSYLRSGH